MLFLLIFTQPGRAGPLDTWTQGSPSPTQNSLRCVVYGGGQFVAVGDGGAIVTSPHGTDWVLRLSGTQNNLFGIAYGEGRFVAVGDTGTVVTSDDAVNWFEEQSGTTNGLSAIAFGNGQFVSVGYDSAGNNGTILTSSDGVIWLSRRSGATNSLEEIAFGNGQFVAAGGNGTVLASADGVNWTQHQSGTTSELVQVACGGGECVALGKNPGPAFLGKSIFTSTDGVSWLSQGVGNFVALGYANDQFMAVSAGSIQGGDFYFSMSPDGVTWADSHRLPLDSPFGGDVISALAYGNGHVVLVGPSVGYGGIILESGPIVNLAMRPKASTGLLLLSLEGPTGLDYTIQSSTDLISWTDVTRITASPSGKVILDGLPVDSGRTFYRAHAQ